MTEPLIIPIRGPQIYYLDRNHLCEHLDVILVSQNGDKLKVNKLQLAAFSHGMFDAEDFEEEAVITTNLELKDLTLVANFITEGLLPLPEKALKNSIPEDLANIFSSFGISLDKVLKNQVLITNQQVKQVKDELLDAVKTELLDVKVEDGDDFIDLPDDFIEELIEQDAITPVKRGRKRGRKKKVPESDPEEDDEWKPLSQKRPKRERSFKNYR